MALVQKLGSLNPIFAAAGADQPNRNKPLVQFRDVLGKQRGHLLSSVEAIHTLCGVNQPQADL